MDRRRQARVAALVPVQVWGMDAHCNPCNTAPLLVMFLTVAAWVKGLQCASIPQTCTGTRACRRRSIQSPLAKLNGTMIGAGEEKEN